MPVQAREKPARHSHAAFILNMAFVPHGYFIKRACTVSPAVLHCALPGL